MTLRFLALALTLSLLNACAGSDAVSDRLGKASAKLSRAAFQTASRSVNRA